MTKADSFASIKKLITLRPFRMYLAMHLLLSSTMTVMSALFFFFVDFYIYRDLTAMGQPNMVRLIAAALMFSMQIVALPFYTRLIGVKGKPYAYSFGAFIWIICGLLLLLMKPGVNDLYIYILAAADGEKCFDSVIGGSVNFMNKTVQAVVLSIVMLIIGRYGFIEAEPGKQVLAQPESAQNAIKAIMAFAPLLFMSAGIFISTKYKIRGRCSRRSPTSSTPATMQMQARWSNTCRTEASDKDPGRIIHF